MTMNMAVGSLHIEDKQHTNIRNDMKGIGKPQTFRKFISEHIFSGGGATRFQPSTPKHKPAHHYSTIMRTKI